MTTKGRPILVQPKKRKLSARTLRRRQAMKDEGLTAREYARKYGSR